MPCKGEVKKRDVLADPNYHDRTVTKFIASMMYDGKKSLTERIFYGSLDLVGDRAKEDALGVFKRALEQVKPLVEVRSRRVGGATYQVPVEVRPPRRISLAMRWLVQHARARPEKSMVERLAWRGDQEEGGYAPDGGGEQGLCPLPLVAVAAGDTPMAARSVPLERTRNIG